jgi:hypothetical protein
MNLMRWLTEPYRIPCGGAGQFVSFGVSVSSRQVLLSTNIDRSVT